MTMETSMAKQIFPKEILQFTADHQVAKHSRKSQLIYSTVLMAILCSIAILPFIYVDVGINAPGILRPAMATSTIKSPEQGQVNKMNFKENSFVNKGDTLIILDTKHLDEKQNTLKQRLADLSTFLLDLELLKSNLTSSPFKKVMSFQSTKYAQVFNEYEQKLFDYNTTYLKAKNDLERSTALYKAKAIAQVDYESVKYDFERAQGAINNYHQSQLTAWTNKIQQYQNEKIQLKTELDQLSESLKRFFITAPISGTVQGSDGLTIGTHLFAGVELFSISPENELLLETYISPTDIGLLSVGQQAKIQIDAFNYNQWGFATGEVTEISKDIIIHNDQPVFKVKCALNTTALYLKNGFKGDLIKGMTAQARFIVTERSLWQLLYDKIDNWLNPNTI